VRVTTIVAFLSLWGIAACGEGKAPADTKVADTGSRDAGTKTGPLRVVYRAGGVPSQPDDPTWNEAPARAVDLIAQAIALPRGGGAVASVSVQAMHDSEWLAMRLRWSDRKPDQSVGVATFRDAVAIGFPAHEGERLPSPFMGDKDVPVNIWQWTADFDADAKGHGSFEAAYPHTAGVWYFPQDDLVTAQVRAWRGFEPVIEFEARGWGSLARKNTQNVYGAGAFANGQWSVVFRRRLATGSGQDTLFQPGDTTNAIFAVWDGSANEVNGAKSISPAWVPVEFDDTLKGMR
jgi:DMSO reductase family type II enzyme heme b subunit